MRKKTVEPLRIDPERGFYPHFTIGFKKEYGAKSVFVLAIADALTARFIRVLIKAGRIEPNTKPLQLGCREAVQTLEELISILQRKKPSSEGVLPVLREATGMTSLGEFLREINGVFGGGTFEEWLSFFQAKASDEAMNLLTNSPGTKDSTNSKLPDRRKA